MIFIESHVDHILVVLEITANITSRGLTSVFTKLCRVKPITDGQKPWQPAAIRGGLSALVLKQVDESRQLEHVLDVIVDTTHHDPAAASLGTLQDADQDAQTA